MSESIISKRIAEGIYYLNHQAFRASRAGEGTSEHDTLIGCSRCGHDVRPEDAQAEELRVVATGDYITYWYCDECFEALYPDAFKLPSVNLPRTLTANFKLTQDGWWIVSVAEMPEVHTQGATFTEACEMLADAVLLMSED